jgi:hypothetical protein
VYHQGNGVVLTSSGQLAGVGYSGFGAHKNAPGDEDVVSEGPIPRGLYYIGAVGDVDGGPHGPFVLPLRPDEANKMFGRSGFLIHGDSIAHTGSASHGCIVVPRSLRERINASSDRLLLVADW